MVCDGHESVAVQPVELDAPPEVPRDALPGRQPVVVGWQYDVGDWFGGCICCGQRYRESGMLDELECIDAVDSGLCVWLLLS